MKYLRLTLSTSTLMFALSSLTLVLLSESASAEKVRIPIGQQDAQDTNPVPTTGMSKTQVEEKFGAPLKKSDPVGKPPISTWTYAEFVVYFEYDHVIHSVRIFRPHTDTSE